MTFCAILGGCLTMVGSTPLIILNSLLANINQFTNFATQGTIKPFSLFEVAPIGLCLLIAGIPYLYLMSKKVKSHKIPSAWNGATKAYFARTYSQGTELYELKFTGKSNFIGSTLKQLENKLPEQTSIIALWQEQECLFPALRKTVIKPNAVIAIMGNIESIKLFAKEHGLKLQPKLEVFSEVLHPTRAGLCEAVVPPSSQLIGTEAKELHMKRAYQLHLLGLFRDNKVYAGSALDNLTLRSGDTLGMFSNWEVLNKFKKNPDFFVLTNSFPLDKFFPKKMPYALGFFFLSICLVIFNIFPISVGLLIGAVGMIATGVLSTDRAYDAVSWKTIFFVAGVMPLGVMLEATGTNQWLISLVNPDNIVMSNWLIQLVLIVISSILSLVISNVGTTVLLVPIAVELAYAIGADPRIYALAVALAASNSFIIPTHQVNALIAGPGGYSSYDFQKFGVGMTIIFILILFITLQVFF
jgi:di/tricarboxylate transporter